jgi:hypothetical protein
MYFLCNCEYNILLKSMDIKIDIYDRPYIICPKCQKIHYLQKDILLLLEQTE